MEVPLILLALKINCRMYFQISLLNIQEDQDFFFCGIIDEPVTILSDKFIILKPSEFHIINSSAIREICIEQTETLYKKSKTKSLSETVSIELLVGFLNPSFLLV